MTGTDGPAFARTGQAPNSKIGERHVTHRELNGAKWDLNSAGELARRNYMGKEETKSCQGLVTSSLRCPSVLLYHSEDANRE